MTIHLLIVEDNLDYLEEVIAIIDSFPCMFHIYQARSRDEAYSVLENENVFLDLAILDLNIPTINDALDGDPKHGHAVFSKIRNNAPGTPIFVLTGSQAEDFISPLLENTQRIDIWSEGRTTSTILFRKKYQILEVRQVLEPLANAIHALSDVELDRRDCDLSIAEDRLIRIFAKKFRGTRCTITRISGGLSGARVFRLRITDQYGTKVHDAIAKLAELDVIREEEHRYDNYISLLSPGATSRKLATLEFGAHKLAGIFFSLAEEFQYSAFDLVAMNPGISNSMIQNIQNLTLPWVNGVPESRLPINSIRQRMINDNELAKVKDNFNLDWIDTFEHQEIQTRASIMHGDLHGFNVLTSASGEVVIIDYGDVAHGFACIDPVTLELSALFHPESRIATKEWPSPEQAAEWCNLDTYIVGCPYPDFILSCRQWAREVAPGDRDIAVCAYSYLIRQLKYDDTNKSLVLTMLEGIRDHYHFGT